MKKEYRGILCSIGASLCFGCGSTFIKLIYRWFGEIPFQDLSFMRSSVCLITFFILALRKGKDQLKLTWKRLLFYAFAGICGLFTVQYFLMYGLQKIPVGVCSFIQSSSTLMVCAYSFAVLHEKPSKEKIAGIITGLLGLTLVVWKKGMFAASATFGVGVIAALLSGLGKTIYLLCGKKAGKENRRPGLMAYGMLFCFLISIPLANKPAVIVHYFEEPRMAAILLLYFMAFSVLPYLLTFRAVELLPASSAGTLNVIEPLAAAISAFFMLSEPLSWNQLLGGALMVGCVILIQRDSSHNVNPEGSGSNG